jgi:hypothetical protein
MVRRCSATIGDFVLGLALGLKRRSATIGGLVLGLTLGLSLGAILGFAVFLGLMCAPYSGCRP